MSMLDALNATVAEIDPNGDNTLAAVIELGRAYARQLDQAATIRRAADKALRDALAGPDEALAEQIRALRAKLSERECVDRIGARLHALLVELQATPKTRPVKSTGRAGGALAGLRAVK